MAPAPVGTESGFGLRCTHPPSLARAPRALSSARRTRARSTARACLASWRKPLRNRFEDPLGVGPFTAVELGVDHLVVEGDLVGRPPPAFQLDADGAREPVGDRLPETSGLGEVVSNGAVLDRDHAGSVVREGEGLTSPGLAARSPGARDQSNGTPSSATPFAWPRHPLSCPGSLLPVHHLQPGAEVTCEFCRATVRGVPPQGRPAPLSPPAGSSS